MRCNSYHKFYHTSFGGILWEVSRTLNSWVTRELAHRPWNCEFFHWWSYFFVQNVKTRHEYETDANGENPGENETCNTSIGILNTTRLRWWNIFSLSIAEKFFNIVSLELVEKKGPRECSSHTVGPKLRSFNCRSSKQVPKWFASNANS